MTEEMSGILHTTRSEIAILVSYLEKVPGKEGTRTEVGHVTVECEHPLRSGRNVGPPA